MQYYCEKKVKGRKGKKNKSRCKAVAGLRTA